jgi:hypothetical protein
LNVAGFTEDLHRLPVVLVCHLLRAAAALHESPR